MAKQREPLGKYLPFLVNRVAIAARELSDADMEQFGLTVPKCRALYALADYGMSRLGELSERTSIELPTLSRIVKVMQADGLVRRRRSTADERAVEITLTAAGRALVDSTGPFANRVEALMTDGLEKPEVRLVRRALAKMFDNLKRAERGAGASDARLTG